MLMLEVLIPGCDLLKCELSWFWINEKKKKVIKLPALSNQKRYIIFSESSWQDLSLFWAASATVVIAGTSRQDLNASIIIVAVVKEQKELKCHIFLTDF